MFSFVWLHFKKLFKKYFLVFGKEEGKDNPSKTRTKPRKKPRQKIINDRRSTRFDGAVLRELQSDDRIVVGLDGVISRRREDRDRRCDLAKRQSRLAKHCVDRDWCSASRDCDLGLHSSDWSSRDWRGLELGVRRRSSDWTGARSSTIMRSLSLSLFFRKYFEVKMKV